MIHWKIIVGVIFTSALVIECRRTHHQKRETPSNLCDPVYNNTNSVQCFCKKSRETGVVMNADCYLTKNGILANDSIWSTFHSIGTAEKLMFTNTRGITLKYIPSKALTFLPGVLSVDVKYGDLKEIPSYAFSNLTAVQEIKLGDNQIEILRPRAFAHHKDVTTITLDKNRISELNRDVFVDLPRLDKLYLTGNKLSTLHDRAFIHLENLKELELDDNSILSLNTESFSGLTNLQRLGLSRNSLEVIGDNTFLPLRNLQSLDLDENKIQMLDEKAFSGLGRLQSLSLARNKLADIENVGVFAGLVSLVSLNLKANRIHHLRAEVMAPIISNFYGASNSFEFDENAFPCDCNLEWFVSLKDHTQNSRLKVATENLKCIPDAKLTERWKQLGEAEKSGSIAQDDTVGNEGDYEYYDDSQLDGKLFYTDIRDIINCTKKAPTPPELPAVVTPKPSKDATSETQPGTFRTTNGPIISVSNATPEKPTTFSSTAKPTTVKQVSTKQYLSRTEPTTSSKVSTGKRNTQHNSVYENDHTGDKRYPLSGEMLINEDKQRNSFTTSRLATVSAKPIRDQKPSERNLYKQMASDEAAKDISETRRRQDSQAVLNKPSASHRGSASVALIITILFLNLA